MRFSLRQFVTTFIIVLFVLALFAAANSTGFFGDAFSGFFSSEAVTGTTGTSGTSGTTGASGTRPSATATVRR